MGWFSGDWFGGIKDLVDNTLTSVLGKDIGGFLGSQGIGKAIENWSNPITQLSDRNPILSMAQGTGDWRGSYKEKNDLENFAENMTELGALAYGGYTGLGGLMGGGEGGAGLGLGAPAEGGSLSNLTSGMGGSSFTMDTGVSSMLPAESGGVFSNFFGGEGMSKMLPYILGGTLLNYAGKKKTTDELAKQQEQYRNAVTWTPERKTEYMGGLSNLIGGLYSNKEGEKKNSLASFMASSGRGGGGFASSSEKIAREKRENIAKALAAGQTTVSTPPNLPLASFVTGSPEGETMTGLSGLLGNYANMEMMMPILKQLYAGK